MGGFTGFLGGLLGPVKRGLDDVAYQALGGPLLGDVLRPPTPAITSQGLLAAANATTPASAQTQANAAGQAAPGAGANYYDDDANLPGPQVGIPGAASASAQTPAATAPAVSAAQTPLTSEDRVKQGLMAAKTVLDQQPAADWQPTSGEKGAMLRSFLGNIGGAMQAGLPIQAGVNQYRTATLNMLQMQQQAKQAAADQQVKQAFTAAMGAAGDDPRAQQAIITQFSAALPKDYMVGMADVYKAFKPPVDQVSKTQFGLDAQGKPVQIITFKSGRTVTQPSAIVSEGKPHFVQMQDGSVLNTLTGETVPGAVLKSYLDKNNGDLAKAFAEFKAAGRPMPNPTEWSTLLSMSNGDANVAWNKWLQGQKELIGARADAGNDAAVSLTPGAVDNAAQLYLTTGQLPPGMGKQAGQLRGQVMNRAAEMAGNQNIAANKADYGSLSSALKQATQQQSFINQFEGTALGSLNMARQLSTQVDRTNAPLFNRWKQSSQQQIAQDPALKSFGNAIETFSNEYAKVMYGGTGNQPASDSARDRARQMLSTADSAAAFQAAANTLEQEMAIRKQSNNNQVADLHGRLRTGVSAGQQTIPGGSISVGGQTLNVAPGTGQTAFQQGTQTGQIRYRTNTNTGEIQKSNDGGKTWITMKPGQGR